MTTEALNSGTPKEAIAQALSRVASEGSRYLHGDPDAREKLVASARDLVAAAETPVESLLWHIWALPTRSAAARIAVDLKIFETTVQDDGRPKTSLELAAPTGASTLLVKRIARTCASMHMLEERGADLYAPNDLTTVLARPEYAAGIIFCWDAIQLSCSRLPAYLRTTNFQNPSKPMDGPFQYANGDGHAFSWLASQPEVFQAFHQNGNASAFVDIGGGTGQILQDFRASVPEYTGRLVLQELPEVIAAAKRMGVGEDGGIELQVHDFFKPQPVRGARVYFMRSVLHDWADEQCRMILGQLKDAMEPGYSKILISDCVIADQKAAWQHLSLDLFMMALVAAQERTESEWRNLIEGCGLKITNIYNKGEGNEGLIEVELE